MNEWIHRLVEIVTPQSKAPVIAIDPEGLLQFPEIMTLCEQRGYSCILAKPGIEARITFELKIRDKPNILFIIEGMYKPLPDIALASKVITISLSMLFPFFDSKALSGLTYNAYCTLDSLKPYQVLGFEGTIRFLLENLYSIDIESLKKFQTKERIIAVVIDVLFNNDSPNMAILTWLKQQLRPFFGAISENLLNKDFLLNYISSAKNSLEKSDLDFSDPILQKAANTLIVNRQLLLKDSIENKNSLIIPKKNNIDREKEIAANIEERIPLIQNQQRDWFEIGRLLGELSLLVFENNNEQSLDRYYTLLSDLNDRFQIFIKNAYMSLHSLSGTRYPVTVHKVLDYIRAQSHKKKALFVIDGMNLWQWQLLKQKIEENKIACSDVPSFAWLPSITAWSRQALFKGAKPILSEDNSKETTLFTEYWLKQGYQSYQISFTTFSKTSEIPDSNVTIAGFVCNDLDTIMHGAIMGNQQLYVDTKTWIESSKIVTFFEALLKEGFTIYVTTDHGNIEAKGIKNLSLSTRNLSKSRGKRHIQFVDEKTARSFIEQNPHLSVGLAGSSIYLKDTSAFTSNPCVVTHGGSHLLEMVIPMGVLQK